MPTYGSINNPSLLFVHGFLGTGEDWQEIIQNMEGDYCCHTLSLPGHGGSPLEDDLLEAVFNSLKRLNPFPEYCIGYSLGGRILLQLKERYPSLLKHLIILSSHIGLATKEERERRWQSDEKWITLLQKEGLDAFLERWYAQELFASLRENIPLYHKVLEQRKKQDPLHLIEIFKKFSLAHQKPCKLYPDTLFLYGAKDLNFEMLYLKLPPFVKVQKVEHAGHALHLENPQGCIENIRRYMNETSRRIPY